MAAAGSPGEMALARSTILPVLRHESDLVAVVTAMQARPDFVISANVAHWNEALAARTRLRILTPYEFLGRLSPPGDS